MQARAEERAFREHVAEGGGGRRGRVVQWISVGCTAPSLIEVAMRLVLSPIPRGCQ